MRKEAFLLSSLALSAALLGCTTTQKGAALGGLGGAALGGVIGHQSGHGVEGALIGAEQGGGRGACRRTNG